MSTSTSTSTSTSSSPAVSIKGKVVIVTGATSGIGREFVKVFAERGAKVVFTGRRADAGKELEAFIRSKGQTGTFVEADVTSSEDFAKVANVAEGTYGGLDLLVNNAGYEGKQLVEIENPASLADFDRVFDINVKGPIRGHQVATPLLKKRGQGAIINISSCASVLPFPKFGIYAASKAALDSITRAAAAELQASNINVYTINPYVFESEMADRAVEGLDANAKSSDLAAKFNPSGKIGKGADLGRFLVELFEGAHAKQYPTGSHIAVEHGNANWPVSEAYVKFVAATTAAAAAAAAAATQ